MNTKTFLVTGSLLFASASFALGPTTGTSGAPGATGPNGQIYDPSTSNVDKVTNVVNPTIPSPLGPTTTAEMTKVPTKKSKITTDEIRDLQEALNNEIDANLTVDGKMGPRTVRALRHYQDSHGLKVTGVADLDTLDALGVDVGDERAPASIQNAEPKTPTESTPIK